MTTYVIPRGGAEASTARPHRALYPGAICRETLASVQALTEPGDTIMILSARYGLVHLDDVLEPYEQRMDRSGRVDTDTITVQAWIYGLTDVYAFLPRAYYDALSAALRPLFVYPQDVYEGTGGIGDQR